jgi:PCRF domain
MKISPQRIAMIESRFAELEARMASGQLEGDAFVTASKEYSELEPVAKAAANVRRLRKEIDTLQHMVKDSSDPDLHDMAVEELDDVTHQLSDAETSLAISLLPKDAADERPALAPAAMRRLCSLATCSACTNAMPLRRGGKSSRYRSAPRTSAVSRKLLHRSRAMACLPS